MWYLFVAAVDQHLKMVAHCIDRCHFQLDSSNIDWQLDLIRTLMRMQRQLLAGSVDMQNRRNHPIAFQCKQKQTY